MATKVIPGLEGVAAAETRLSYVDGLAGELFIGGHPLMELAPHATFEEAAFLLWHDRLPNEAELAALKSRFQDGQELPRTTKHVLEAAAARKAPVIDALRMACATLSLGDPNPDDITPEGQLRRAERICAAFPVIVASYVRDSEKGQGRCCRRETTTATQPTIYVHAVRRRSPTLTLSAPWTPTS